MIIFAFLGSACGGSKNAVGASDAYQDGSKNCSQKFVDDYNVVAQASQKIGSAAEARTFRSQVVAFGEKYKDVVCTMEVNGDKLAFDVNAVTKKTTDSIDGELAHHGG